MFIGFRVGGVTANSRIEDTWSFFGESRAPDANHTSQEVGTLECGALLVRMSFIGASLRERRQFKLKPSVVRG